MKVEGWLASSFQLDKVGYSKPDESVVTQTRVWYTYIIGSLNRVEVN